MRHFSALCCLPLFLCGHALAAVLPPGFAESPAAGGFINSATAFAIAPDGRIFVCQQTGAVRVIKNGNLLSTPFVSLDVDSTGERGLLGVAFDPNFNQNQYVYLYYTVDTAPRHNRVARFTAGGDVAQANSETLIFRLNDLSASPVHNGGGIHFGPDGKLYIGAGENGVGANSQTTANLLGKMLRINKDGSIPTDNPYYLTAAGDNRAIWAMGLRNPFTFAFQPGTGRMFINDVGGVVAEEINDGVAAANYGWPTTEGYTTLPQFRGPLFAYDHGAGLDRGCAVTGGAFYNPSSLQFPSSYWGLYFFADLCNGWIRTFNPATGAAASFASGISAPVDLRAGADGALYYLSRGSGMVFRVTWLGGPGGLRFVPAPPCRVIDTRLAAGPFGGPSMPAGAERTVAVPSSACGIPSTAVAYSLNATAIPSSGVLAFLTLWPTGLPRPLVSTLNSFDGRIKANAAIVAAGVDGAVNLYVTHAADVVLDIGGYFVPSSPDAGLAFYPVSPCRISDTRNATGPLGGPAIGAGQTRSFPILSASCAIPASAQAYSLNMTAVPSGPLAFLTTWPTGLPRPSASTLNAFTGAVTANAAIVPAGTGGAVDVYATHATHLVIDINGYFAPPGSPGELRFYPLTPCRATDTRLPAAPLGGPSMGSGETRLFPVQTSDCGLHAAAQAYALNATVVPSGPLGYLTLWPSGYPQPNVSTLNSWDGTIASNAAIVLAGGDGSIVGFVTDASELILDVAGYFAP